MPKSPVLGVIFFSLLLIPLPAFAATGPKSDSTRLKSSYAANEWHMKRFMREYLELERKFASDLRHPEFVKRTQTLKMQIDLLSRENERILNALDEPGKSAA